MLNYAILFLFAVCAFADGPCCREKERSMSYLDVAIDLISKAKSTMPGCEGKKECPKRKECPEVIKCYEVKECSVENGCPEEKDCPEVKECPKMKECPQVKECPKIKDCPEVKECPKMKECPKEKECPKIKECPKEKDCPDGKECPEAKECPEPTAFDCADWYENGYNKSGVYTIRPISRLIANMSLDVFCDMDTDGGGWTVIQRRGNFSRADDYFYKNWLTYKEGFGNKEKDFWIGNDNLFTLTNQKLYSIRFDMQDKDLNKAYAKYSDFWIDDEFHKYMLHIFGYSGNAGDGMKFHDNKNFSAKDQKNDASSHNCAVKYKSAWWFSNCYYVNLNGLYNAKQYGVSWHLWRNASLPSLIWAEMKIRPKMFNS